MSRDRLLLVGNPNDVHVGAHLLRAAASLGIEARMCDSTAAFGGPGWRQKIDWWARGRRPARLREFSARVAHIAQTWRPSCLIATGISPLDESALTAIGGAGITRINVLTDDPWNPAHRAPWFMASLPAYDHVFTPRRANLSDLHRSCGRPATYLPFAYAPEVHFPEFASDTDRDRQPVDVMFAGGADRDRVSVITTLIGAGLKVALHGGYWDRFADTKEHARGMLDASGLRKATSAAKVCLCLVRRANRDSHSMRSYEIPAMRGCVLAEDTDDHRALFGADGGAALLFSTVDDAVEKLRALVRDDDRRRRLARTGHQRVTSGGHAYKDRLIEILRVACGVGEAPARVSIAR